jgi:hypothetical protein
MTRRPDILCLRLWEDQPQITQHVLNADPTILPATITRTLNTLSRTTRRTYDIVHGDGNPGLTIAEGLTLNDEDLAAEANMGTGCMHVIGVLRQLTGQ